MTTIIQPITADTWFPSHLMHYLDHLVSVQQIDKAVGNNTRVKGDARKVRHQWQFRIDGEPAAIWDYYGKRWSIYDPSGKLVAYLATHGLTLDARQPSAPLSPTERANVEKALRNSDIRLLMQDRPPWSFTPQVIQESTPTGYDMGKRWQHVHDPRPRHQMRTCPSCNAPREPGQPCENCWGRA